MKIERDDQPKRAAEAKAAEEQKDEAAREKAARLQRDLQEKLENPEPEEEPDAAEDDEDEYDDEPRRGCGCGVVGLVLALLFAAALLGGAWLMMKAMDEAAGNEVPGAENVVVTVEKGQGPAEIAEMLEKLGVIEHASFFKGYLKLTGDAAKLQYGEFTVRPGMSYDELIERLSVMKPRDTVWITFPEGSTIFQFAKRVEEAGICTAEEFIDAANNGDYSDIGFWQKIDTDPDTFMKAEGYLFPDTYQFYADETPENVVRKLFEQFDKEITPEMYARMDEIGMSLREVITLASMVQEEAGHPADQPLVASVFRNRLAEDSPYPRLGSDVTWYFLEDFVFPYYAAQNDVDASQGESVTPDNIKNAYYTGDNDPNARIGLPAGPLSCPGRDAIKASLWPQESNYYFFLTDVTGKYYYAETYDGHLANLAAAKRVNDAQG